MHIIAWAASGTVLQGIARGHLLCLAAPLKKHFDHCACIASPTAGVPVENQKLLFKGQLKDEQTLQVGVGAMPCRAATVIVMAWRGVQCAMCLHGSSSWAQMQTGATHVPCRF